VIQTIIEAARRRTDALTSAMRPLTHDEWLLPSTLPGWSRLTLLCHLRYGAAMTRRMTIDTTEGRPTAFYPDGRDTQRPRTLRPEFGESPRDVVESFVEQSVALADVWAALHSDDWTRTVIEASGRAESGRVALTIADLALLRLTEVEVHGTDIDLGLDGWSAVFVDLALPRRMAWLGRRSPPRVDESTPLPLTWVLAATDGLSYSVHIDRNQRVTTEVVPFDAAAQHRVQGERRHLLALLLGRMVAAELSADESAISSFRQTFPGP
jgi:uncharacterized protein (TIGR03083 family)